MLHLTRQTSYGADMRTVTAEEIDAFERDGVVCLRRLVSPVWLERMNEPVARAVHTSASVDLTAMGAALGDSEAGTNARFYAGTDHWRTDPVFEAFARESPLPAATAALLRSEALWLYEDSVLVKEPGNADVTAFHQDLGYFHVRGRQIATVWCPLDPVSAETGALRFVRGSHLWDSDFRPNFFVSDLAIPETQGIDVPDIDSEPGRYDTVTFSLEPGDVTVHHARTLHGAGGNASRTLARRAISVRYCGDDVRYQIKQGAPQKPHHARVADGDPLDGADCPRVWPPA